MRHQLKITVEGLTGSGKSTLARYIHDAIEDFIPGSVLHLNDEDAERIDRPEDAATSRLQAMAAHPGLEISISTRQIPEDIGRMDWRSLFVHDPSAPHPYMLVVGATPEDVETRMENYIRWLNGRRPV